MTKCKKCERKGRHVLSSLSEIVNSAFLHFVAIKIVSLYI